MSQAICVAVGERFSDNVRGSGLACPTLPNDSKSVSGFSHCEVSLVCNSCRVEEVSTDAALWIFWPGNAGCKCRGRTQFRPRKAISQLVGEAAVKPKAAIRRSG